MGLINCTPYFIEIADGYFIRTMGGGLTEIAQDMTLDSAGNNIIVGYTDSIRLFNNDGFVIKSDAGGNILWNKILEGAGNDQLRGVATDSSNNIYGVGYTTSGDPSGIAFIVKYNSSGVLQWQKLLGISSIDLFNEIIIDASDNVFVVGYSSSQGQGGNDILLVKYNSSGTLQWQKLLGDTGTDQGYSIVVDSTGNIYVAGNTRSQGSGNADLLIIKYNSSGNVIWQKLLGGADWDYGEGIVVDSLDNIYITGNTGSTGAGGRDLLIVKYNSSGTLQWQRTLGGTANDFGSGMTIDSSDNIFVVGTSTNSSTNIAEIIIAKYNSSGTIQWQRILNGGGSDYGYGIEIDNAANDLYITGFTRSEGPSSALLMKVPADGSLTGTYGNFVYSVSTLTAGNGSLTQGTSTLTAITSTLTASSGSFVSASFILNPTVIVATTLQITNFRNHAQGNEKIVIDSNGDKYLVGYTQDEGAGSADLMVVKINDTGVIWGRIIGGASNDRAQGIAIDSSDNIYLIGSTASAGAGIDDIFIVKYTSAGVIVWQRTLGDSGPQYGYGITVDASNNIIVVGQTGPAEGQGGYELFVAKYNSSGTILWQLVTGGGGTDTAKAVATDASNNIYVVGTTASEGPGSTSMVIVKYNSSGTLQWQRTLGSINNDSGWGCAVDSSSNVYLLGYGRFDGDFDMLIAKFSSSGTLLWQRAIGNDNQNLSNGVVIDASDNVYIYGNGALIQYSSAGTLLFQKLMTNIYGLAVTATEITVITSARVVFVMDTDASVLSDGSLVSISSSLTTATSGLITAATSLTSASSSLTAINSTLVSGTVNDLKIGMTVIDTEIV